MRASCTWIMPHQTGERGLRPEPSPSSRGPAVAEARGAGWAGGRRPEQPGSARRSKFPEPRAACRHRLGPSFGAAPCVAEAALALHSIEGDKTKRMRSRVKEPVVLKKRSV